MGLTDNYTEILGVKIPQLILPLQPGRNVAAVLEARSRGVTVLCTAHGGAFRELMHREGMGELFAARIFERYVRLTNCGQIDEIRNEEGEAL